MANSNRIWTLLIGCGIAAAAHAQTTKQQIIACQEAKLLSARSVSDFSHKGDLVCHPGHIDGFRGCVDREVKESIIDFRPPDGYRVIEARSVENSRTARTGLDGFTWNASSAKARISCDGHGCGGEGRVWIDVSLVGKMEKVPTEIERRGALQACLDELLK